MSNEVRELQNKLKNDAGTRENFVNSHSENVASSDSDEETARLLTVLKRPHKKNDNGASLMLQQLLKKEEEYNKLQKKYYELDKEYNSLDTQNHYIKLDLNNSDLKVEELENKVKNISTDRFYYLCESMFWRFVLVLYLIYLFIGLFS